MACRTTARRVSRSPMTRRDTGSGSFSASSPVKSDRSAEAPVRGPHAFGRARCDATTRRSEEHTSELQSLAYLVCRLLLEKKKHLDAIMITSIVALLGALPLALRTGVGYDLSHPVGTYIVCMLIMSQMLTLYTTAVVPLE